MKSEYFSKIKRRLSSYSKKNRVELYFISGNDTFTNYFKVKNHRHPAKVVIKIEQSRTVKVCVLLHELGHYRDSVNNSKLYKEVNKKVYNHPSFSNGFAQLTKTQKKMLIAAEVRAWDEAEVLAQELKIRLGAWFYNSRKKQIGGYYKNWSAVSDDITIK
jgi:hypothetical protein